MHRLIVSRAWAALFLTAGLFLVLMPFRAEAACHHFTIVSVSPSTITEGGSANVTVKRDGMVGPSNVDVVSINETAKAGQDFPSVSRTVSFTTETELTFSISTTNDATHESTETFRLHLQNGSGCANTNYVYDPDARVTIKDNDPVPTPTQSQSQSPGPTGSPTPRQTQSATPSPSPTPAGSPSVLPTPTPSDTPTLPEPTSTGLAVGPPSPGGSGPKLGVAITGGILLAGAAFVWVALRRSRPQL